MKFVSASRRLVPVLGAALLLVLPLTVAAAGGGHGSLDLSFGKGGTVVTAIDGSDAGVVGVVRQPDGKLVAAGECCGGLFKSLMIVRYREDGSVDRSFGHAGMATGDVWPQFLVRQPDGKLVVAGRGETPTNVACGPCLNLARYNANGSLDRSFGVGGNVFTYRAYGAAGLALQPDGKLVVAAERSSQLLRYNVNGSLDRSFGSGGVVATRFKGGAWAIVIQPDGKLVVAGGDGSSGLVAVVRYNRNGSLDRSFGNGGKAMTPVGKRARFGVLVRQPDGKLVAAGGSGPEFHEVMALVRYEANGALDRSFGSRGMVTTRIGSDAYAAALALQPDGKIVAAGGSSELPGLSSAHYAFVLTRYNTNGSVDRGFGSAGSVRTRIGSQAGAWALVILPDGKLVAAGYSDFKFALARYRG